MQANYVQRLRFTFSKFGPTRFIGHLDLARTLERALNRARIPVAYTQGFNRRPRMQLASALPLGTTSECELADILLTEPMVPDQALTQMMSKMAPGITIHAVEEVPISGPSLQNMTIEAHYRVTFLDVVDKVELQQRIQSILTADSIIRVRQKGRKRKEYDLRPLIIDITIADTPQSAVGLNMHLFQMPGKTGRPDEVLYALELDPAAARIHRTQLILDENQQR